MNILIVPSWYPTSNNPTSGIFFREQALALYKNGNNVDILHIKLVTIKEYIFKRKIVRYKDNGINVCVCLGLSFFSYRRKKICERTSKVLKRNLKKILDVNSYDIVHAHSFCGAGYAVCKNKHLFNCPIIVTEHTSKISNKMLNKNELNKLEFTINNSDKFICVSNNLKEVIKEYVNVKVNIDVVPNMVDDIFEYRYKRVDNKKFVFVAVGNLVEIKQYEIMINSFAEAFMFDENVELWIIGEGNERNNITKTIYKNGLINKVKLLGTKDKKEIYEIFQKCNVFIHTSRSETFGIALIEALACGLPSISTANGGSNEILNNYGTVKIKIGDINDISLKMKYIKDNYEVFDKKRISNECKEKYSSKVVINRLIKIYNDIRGCYEN